MSEKILEIENLTKSYDKSKVVLNNLSFSLEKGEVVVVIGPSGCGKSTFLRCLNKLEEIDSGKINLNGKEIITPEGNYLTIFFDDNWENINKYYYKMIDYIEKNNIEVEGDFNEVWIMPRVDSNGKEKTFGYIEILIKNNK